MSADDDMKTDNRTSGGAPVAPCTDDTGCTRVACEVCLSELPADAVNVADAQDYVHHFCGLGCLEQWQKQSETRAPETPGKSANRIK
ncbi:MAG: DUF3330 domain-containing protein [Thiobacillus sp.]|nr:DUF3330 domain-containing protein [Thiobacillus sp.]